MRLLISLEPGLRKQPEELHKAKHALMELGIELAANQRLLGVNLLQGTFSGKSLPSAANIQGVKKISEEGRQSTL